MAGISHTSSLRLTAHLYSSPDWSAARSQNSPPQDALTELSEVHERSRRSMKSVFKALWPNETVPEGMSELADRLKGARRRFQAWKISACREGAREAWAMIKTRFTGEDTKHLAEVGPRGLTGRKYHTHLVYDNVMPAARLSNKTVPLIL